MINEISQTDRLSIILRASDKVTFSKNIAQALVGGRSRLERLVSEKKIRAPKSSKRKNGRWECNAADVLRYTIESKHHAPC